MYYNLLLNKQSCKIKVSLNAESFVKEVRKMLRLSGQEGQKKREIHGLQSLCQGAGRF